MSISQNQDNLDLALVGSDKDTYNSEWGNTSRLLPGTIGQKYECRYCNANTKTKKEYSEHLKTHKVQGSYKCTWPTCEMKCRTLCTLRQHYEKHQPKLLCEGCGSLFYRKDVLEKHEQQCNGGNR
ncbi:hypothetical protein LOAG_15749 [Loa loa]|uniref:C2H2-type domain-containing protein n=2 Tax=Loa loa TaxID=7209 RepID=A0A1S0TF49_LOALO|nr:hypothetical protein LOAG_15749 [Loa loa]EFO12784.1 hypothetical protein LOAG_15749 [Loa loa]